MTHNIIAAQKAARYQVQRILRNHIDDVDDVLQEAAIKAFLHADEFKGNSKYSTWFTSIAINSALFHLRYLACRLRSGCLNVDDYPQIDNRTPEKLAIQAERADTLYAAIEMLPRGRKIAASRWLLGEKTLTNTEKSARHHARLQLRELLEVVQ